ncbi:MAG: hypothetical protein WCC63_06930 [Candidatus Bathyarchaeia archaeon]
MKKASLFLTISVFVITSIALFAPCNTYAASPSQVRVDRVDHAVAPLYGGLILINDTVRITPTSGNTTIEEFSIGFSLEYKDNLRYSMAYESENIGKPLNIILDTGLDVEGYYGVTVSFPEEARDLLYNGHSYTFTVMFVLSGTIDSSTKTTNGTARYTFTADFPAFPSLAQNASTCNVTVILPENTNRETSELPFNVTQKQNQYYLNYTKNNLPAYTRNSTEVSFGSSDKNAFACFSTKKLTREVSIDTEGRISLSDIFLLESRTTFTLSKIRLQLAGDAENVAALDEIGKVLTATPLQNETQIYEVSLNLVTGQSRSFKVTYILRKENHLASTGGQSFSLNLSLSEGLRVMPETFTLRITFPEGAAIQSFPSQEFEIQRDVFQERLSLTASNVTWLQNEQWSFTYSHTIFWEAFRPTLWATAIVIIGSIIAFVLQRPKAPVSAVSIILVPRKTLNDFVETYEEKKKILSELGEVKRKAVKGKISRREYKVRKTTLESQLASNSKRLGDLRQKIVSGGAKYADIMRQLEVSETELDNIEADIKRIEVRFKSGEISALTYRQLLEEDLKRREKAETAIDGVLLRLRE